MKHYRKSNFSVPPEELITHFGGVYKDEWNVSIRASKTFFHPRSYILGNDSVHQNDIVVLELEEDVQFDEMVQPICLPLGFRERVGEVAIFAGYGKKEGKRDRSRVFG